CFCELVHLGASINKLSLSDHSTFREQCIAIFNKRYNEFADPLYLLCFFLHPQYDGKKFKIIKFKIIKFKVIKFKIIKFKIIKFKIIKFKIIKFKIIKFKIIKFKIKTLIILILFLETYWEHGTFRELLLAADEIFKKMGKTNISR